MYKKLLSLLLTLVIVGQQIVFPFAVVAQEVQSEATVESTPSATPTATAEPTATSTAAPTTEPTDTPVATPTSTPSPTIPPYKSAEYDVYKAEKNKNKAERQIREDEWEANEEDEVWVAAHGGNEEYYVSGQWHKDQEVKRAQEAQAQQQQNNAAVPTQTDPFTQNNTDPFATTNNANNGSACSNTNGGASTLGTEDAWANTTGDSNTANTENNDTHQVSNNNCADLGNNSYAGGISGDNTVSGNDSGINLSTGTSTGNGQLVNNANENIVDSENFGQASSSAEESFAEEGSAENLNTEEDSANFSQDNNSYSLTVENNNAATVDNEMTVEGRSGNNSVTENDGNVELTTGDVELIANMLNLLNLNITGDDFLHLIVNIFGQLNGTVDLDDIASILGYEDDDALEIIARNDDTGEDSTNTANSTSNTNVDVNNNNEAVVNNELNVSGVSGRNEVSGNDGGADVITGRIEIMANILNFINANFSGEKWTFIMINIFGGLSGNLIVPGTSQYLGDGSGSVTAENTNPGEGSSNNQSATSIDQTSVTNTNNVELTNNINANGVSGQNTQVGNDDGDGAHTMQTGGTDVASNILNFLNFNITGNNWVFLIVNVFGKWMGQIVGFADNAPLNAPTNGTFAALSVGGGTGGNTVTAVNNNTGEGSTNTANTTATNTTDVNNTNSATVNNTINVEGISGQNNVSNNDSKTSLTTGWVEIDANLLNIINTNITGRSWMVVFVNVFGDFMGNLFFGQQAADSYAASQASSTDTNSRGGVSNTGSQQSESSTQQTQVSDFVSQPAKPTSALKTTSKSVLGTGVDQESTDEVETYTASYESEEFSEGSQQDTPEDQSKGLIARIYDFLQSVYSKVRGVVQPMLARIQSVIVLS